MTAAEVAREFDIVWNGGELLPAHASTSTLWQGGWEKRGHTVPEKPRYCGPGIREMVKVLHGNGLPIAQIAVRLKISRRVICAITQELRVR